MTPSTEYDSNASVSSTGSRPRRRRRLWLSITAAVVVVVIGGTYLTLRETVWAGPPTSGLTTQWKGQRQAVGCIGPGARPWIIGGLVVECSNARITAMRISTGRVAWTWNAPRLNGVPSIAQLSIGTDSGIGVVDYANGLAGIEIATGRRLWTSAYKGVNYNPIWVGRGRFAVAQGPGSGRETLEVRDLATGKLDWSSTAPGRALAHCHISQDALAGPWLYAAATCAGHADRLYQLSVETGKVIAHAPLADHACKAASGGPALWAVPGYVLWGCEPGDNGPKTIRPVVITAGTVRERPLSWTGNPPNVKFLADAMGEDQLSAVSGNSLYLGLDITKNDKHSYQIAAIDLKTARLRWDKTITIPHTPSHAEVQPVNLLGANSHGVFDAIEVISRGDDERTSTGMTLATLSASNGHLSYGPGTTYGPPHPDDDPTSDDQPNYYLAGHVLLSLSQCGPDCPDDDAASYGPTIGYNTGSWPQS